MRKKMYKKGKFWVVASIAATSVLAGTTVKADEVKTSSSEEGMKAVQADLSTEVNFDSLTKNTSASQTPATAPAIEKTQEEKATATPQATVPSDNLEQAPKVADTAKADTVKANTETNNTVAPVLANLPAVPEELPVRSAARAGASAQERRTTNVTVDGNSVKFQFVGTAQANDKIKFAFWSDKNGQDDLIWYDADATGAAYTDLRKHRDYGKYNIHTYAERAGRMVGLAAEAVNVPVPNVTATPSFIDVSSHNGSISTDEYRNLARQGVAGVVVKLTEGTYYKNPYAASQIRNAQEAGLKVSTYAFSHYKNATEARQEARYFANMAKELRLPNDTVMVNDIEDNNMRNASLNSSTQTWKQEMNNLGFGNTMYYTSASWLNTWGGPLDTNALGLQNFWVAQYPSRSLSAATAKQMNYHNNAGAWQFTSNAELLTGKHVFDQSIDYSGRFTGKKTATVNAKATAQVKLENLNLNAGTYDVIVSNITAPNGLAGVKVPTWSDKNGQDDLVWYDAQRQANGTYKFTLNIRDHKNERGTYNSHVYVVDRNNQVTGVGGVKASFEKASAKLAITNAKPGSYDVVVSNLTAPNGVREVLVPTWSDRAGQDDLIWHKATKQANGNYTFTVKASEHKNDAGTYYTHAYVVDNNGNRQFLAGTKANMQAPIKASAKLAITNAKPGSYDVVVSNLNAPNGVREVLVPTWSDRAGQDDLIWHKATKQANGNYTFTVKAGEHKNDAGTYYTHAYVVDNNGNRQFLTGTKANMQVPIKASAKLAVTNVKPGSYDVVVSNLNAPNGVREVLVPTWSDRAGQDDLIWHKATKQANGNYTFTVKAGEHKNDAGTYYTHAYVVDNNGNRQFLAGTKANMQAPIKASAKLAVTNAKPGSYDVVVSNLNAPNGVKEVLVPTWSDRAGQDDLIWHKATKQANGNYTFTVKASDHKNDAGTYYTHAYVVDNNGNRQFLAGTKANMQAPIKASAKLAITNAKPGSYDVVVSNLNAPNGVREVLVPTWSERAGQDDLIWHKATKQANGNYTFTVKASEHKNDAGTYYTHAYVVDAEGKRQILATATATMTLPATPSAKVEIKNVNHNAGSYDVIVSNIFAPKGIRQVLVPSWSDKNSQDDLIWHAASRQADGSYKVTIKTSDHKYDTGLYHSHVYVLDNTGAQYGVGATSTTLKASTQTNAQISYKGTGRFEVNLRNINTPGEVLFAVWSSKNGQDDIRWYGAQKNGNQYTGAFNAQDHKDTGEYNVHIYQKQNGQMVGLLGTSVNVNKSSFSAPYFSQRDGRWGGTVYGLGNMDATGCVPTTLAMAISALKNETVMPTTVANYLYNNTNTFNKVAIGTGGRGVVAAARHWGLDTNVLRSEGELSKALSDGYYVTAAVGGGNFSSGYVTHEILLKGNSNGRTYVLDPYNANNNGWYGISYLHSIRSMDPDDNSEGSPFIKITDR